MDARPCAGGHAYAPHAYLAAGRAHEPLGYSLDDVVGYLRTIDYRLQLLEQARPVHSPPPAPAAPAPRGARFRLRDLDPHCRPAFARTFSPSKKELADMSRDVERSYPSLKRGYFVPAIRHWFRKRRDELGQRVFTACDSHLKGLFLAGTPLAAVCAELRRRQQLHRAVYEACGLDGVFEDDAVGTAFMLAKIEAYHDRRILNKAPARGRPPGSPASTADDSG